MFETAEKRIQMIEEAIALIEEAQALVDNAVYASAAEATYTAYDKYDEGILADELGKKRVADNIRYKMFDTRNTLMAGDEAYKAAGGYGDVYKRKLIHEGIVKGLCTMSGRPEEK